MESVCSGIDTIGYRCPWYQWYCRYLQQFLSPCPQVPNGVWLWYWGHHVRGVKDTADTIYAVGVIDNVDSMSAVSLILYTASKAFQCNWYWGHLWYQWYWGNFVDTTDIRVYSANVEAEKNLTLQAIFLACSLDWGIENVWFGISFLVLDPIDQGPFSQVNETTTAQKFANSL
jgi:hypothetical protein